MPASSDAVYERVIGRITRAIVVIGAIGAVALAQREGWRFAIGFVLGAAMSYLSFWRWRKVVEALGSTPKPRSIAPMVIRFVLLVAAAYGIIKFLKVNPVAVFLGLLVSAAAVVVSIILELIYA